MELSMYTAPVITLYKLTVKSSAPGILCLFKRGVKEDHYFESTEQAEAFRKQFFSKSKTTLTAVDAVQDDKVWRALDHASAVNFIINPDDPISNEITRNPANKFLIGVQIKNSSENVYTCGAVNTSAAAEYFLYVQRGDASHEPLRYSLLKLGHTINLDYQFFTPNHDFDDGEHERLSI